MTPDERLAALRKNAEGYRDAMRETRPLAQASQQHTDQSLIWQIGLMGGGLYGLSRLVETPCVTTEAVWIGIAGAIWVVGILSAVIGRIVSREHTNEDAFLSVQKIQAVETLLLRDPGAEELGHTLLDIMNDQHLDMKARAARLRALGRSEDVLYYTTNTAFAVGVIVAFSAAVHCLMVTIR